jgi:hypothetical protein
MHTLLRTIDKPHIDFAEIVLREFPRQPLETHQRPGRHRARRLHQRVEGALGAVIALELRATQNLQRQQLGLGGQELPDEVAKRLRLRRPADAPALTLERAVNVDHRHFSFHAPHASARYLC